MNKVCQSCAMPLKKDPGGGGTNADGSISTQYCSHCFENGKFRAPDITVSEMRAFVKNKMEEMGFPAFLAGWFTRSIPRNGKRNILDILLDSLEDCNVISHEKLIDGHQYVYS